MGFGYVSAGTKMFETVLVIKNREAGRQGQKHLSEDGELISLSPFPFPQDVLK